MKGHDEKRRTSTEYTRKWDLRKSRSSSSISMNRNKRKETKQTKRERGEGDKRWNDNASWFISILNGLFKQVKRERKVWTGCVRTFPCEFPNQVGSIVEAVRGYSDTRVEISLVPPPSKNSPAWIIESVSSERGTSLSTLARKYLPIVGGSKEKEAVVERTKNLHEFALHHTHTKTEIVEIGIHDVDSCCWHDVEVGGLSALQHGRKDTFGVTLNKRHISTSRGILTSLSH